MDRDAWNKFECRAMDLANGARQFNAVKYADTKSTDVLRNLNTVDKALTKALQALAGLDLLHEVGQDLETDPYNWPVALDLAHYAGIFRRNATGVPMSDDEWGQYPTSVILAMQELRNAARAAAKSKTIKPGNSKDRAFLAKVSNELGDNFVFYFRGIFGYMPPMSKTGPVVELLSRVLDAASLKDVDASDVLRRAIERDPMRDLLPSATAQISKQNSI